MLRANRFEECIRFYDQLMPELNLEAVHRDGDFVDHIGGRTALAIRPVDRGDADHPHEGPWAPGYYSLSFRDPEGIRLEVNRVPGKGVLAEDTSFDPAPDHPLTGQP